MDALQPQLLKFLRHVPQRLQVDQRIALGTDSGGGGALKHPPGVKDILQQLIADVKHVICLAVRVFLYQSLLHQTLDGVANRCDAHVQFFGDTGHMQPLTGLELRAQDRFLQQPEDQIVHL